MKSIRHCGFCCKGGRKGLELVAARGGAASEAAPSACPPTLPTPLLGVESASPPRVERGGERMEPKPEVASCLRPNPRRKQPSGEGNIGAVQLNQRKSFVCHPPPRKPLCTHTHTPSATRAGPGPAKDSVVLDGPNSAPGEGGGFGWTSSMPSAGKRGAFLPTSQAPFRKHAEEEETSDSLTPSAASGGTDVTSAVRKALGEEVPAGQGFGA